MNLEFYNCPQAETMADAGIRFGSDNVQNTSFLPEKPLFCSYEPKWQEITNLVFKYKNAKNVLVIGHGGSISSFYGFYNVLKYQSSKNAYFLSTIDPDYICELKTLISPADTVVVAISKSGDTMTQLEALSQFMDFPVIAVTGLASPLRAISEKMGYDIVLHPNIGGRFTAFSEVGLLPAALCGLDIKNIFFGGRELHSRYNSDNLPFKAASIFRQLEQQGFADVFMPFYSHGLFAMSNLVVQLCHESFGKEGKGQTYFAHEAPESQHHTNQRFFGGKKNICGFFTTCHKFNHQLVAQYPTQTHSVQLRGKTIFDMNKIPFEEIMKFEISGTMQDARIKGIPFAHLELSGLSASEIGRYVALWQLYAVYGSILRNVNPFDQPQVEASKNISFNKRLEYKGFL